jgi:hypothetical protein
LGRGTLLKRHGLDAVFFNAGIQKPSIPLWFLVVIDLVDLAVLHCQQRDKAPHKPVSGSESQPFLFKLLLSLAFKVARTVPLYFGSRSSGRHVGQAEGRGVSRRDGFTGSGSDEVASFLK